MGRPTGARGPDRFYKRGEKWLAIHTSIAELSAPQAAMKRNLLAYLTEVGADGISQLERLLEECREVPEDRLREVARLGRGLCAHQLGLLSGFPDDHSRGPMLTHNRILLAIDDADLMCFLATGHGLRGPTDYRKFKPSGSPSATTIYKLYGKPFSNALRAAQVQRTPQAELRLVKSVGRPKGSTRTPTHDERVLAVARAREFFLGRRLTYDAFNEISERAGTDLPSARSLTLGIKAPAGKNRWDYLQDLAGSLALAEPDRFPWTSSYVGRTQHRLTRMLEEQKAES